MELLKLGQAAGAPVIQETSIYPLKRDLECDSLHVCAY